MEKGIYGRFYFKKTNNGNLIGEYSNYGMNENLTESADLIKPENSRDHFEGEYVTTWREDDLAILADLIIEQKPESRGQIFDLQWLSENKVLYTGQGFLCDDILIGDYQSK